MSFTNFQIEALNAHNKYRAKHGAQPLTLNLKLCSYAQQWANNLAARNTMQHRQPNKYGENLYACFGKTNITGAEAVTSWYNEIKYYIFGSSDPGARFSKVGHFTQVVWKNSRTLGVGVATVGRNVYVVCNYDPPGNYKGQYAQNFILYALTIRHRERSYASSYEVGENIRTMITCNDIVDYLASSQPDFEIQVLRAHNKYRAKHGSLPLRLNQNLCSYAQQWANTLATFNSVQHRQRNSYGENLYVGYGKTDISGEEVVSSWYNQIKDYSFGLSDPGERATKVCHFTQVVWKASRELGVGIATAGSKVYVVCNYDPPGNFSARYAQNVSK